jgi:membrane protein
MKIHAVLFDLDGTLVDSNDLHVDAWEQVLREAGHETSRDAIHAQIGKGADMFVPALVQSADQTTIKELGDRHGAIFKDRFIGQVRPFPGASALLARVAESGRKVVLASSASKEELEHYLDLLGARSAVTGATSIDDVERSKPAPDIFAAALQQLDGIGPDAALAVGDSPYDVESAGSAGIATVALRSGGFPDEALTGAAAIYDDVAALLADFENSPLSR